jgi:hypothetical protein
VSLQRLTKKEDCANRIVVLTVASCMMSLSDLPMVSRGKSRHEISNRVLIWEL